MKKYYKIQEIAKLYHIQPDSLRYYEKVGLIHPTRSKSNYRLYSLNDIYVLNIIRDCLKLGYDTRQIKEYLDNRSVDHTIQFLMEEQRMMEEQIQDLQKKYASICTRIQDLKDIKEMKLNTCQVTHYPKRYCRYLKEQIEKDETIDYLLTKLSESMEEDISILGNMDSGSIVEQRQNDFVYTSVFILTNDTKYDFILEEGSYCTFTYRGKHNRSKDIFLNLFHWIENHNYKVDGPFLEFLLVDIHETKNVEEYVTSIHVKVKSKE